MVNWNGLMEEFMKGNGKLDCNMDRVEAGISREIGDRANGRKANVYESNNKNLEAEENDLYELLIF